MNKLKDILTCFALVVIITTVTLGSCMDWLANNVTHAGLMYRPPALVPSDLQSWDQANLKRNDHGCPTAVFVAPNGDLVQCQTKLDGTTPVTDPNILAQIEKYRPHSSSEWHRFKTLDAAGLYAADRLEKCSHYYECSTLIVVDPEGKFAVGPAHTDYASDHVMVTKSGVPSDWPVAAAVHTHPCVPNHFTGLFSIEDVMGAISSRTVSFMVDMCRGDVHKFTPGLDKPDVVEAQGAWMTPGRVIGHVLAFPGLTEANEGI